MSFDPAVPRKLGVEPSMRILLLNAPTEHAVGFAAAAGGDAQVEASDGDGPLQAESFDLVQLFCSNRADLERLAEAAIVATKPRGRLWVCYPKGGSGVETDLSRDVRWDPLVDAGWRPVTQVSVDAVWSALRFRPESEVGIELVTSPLTRRRPSGRGPTDAAPMWP